MKSGNGNEKVGIPTFEFSAGRRQCCLVAIEYCVLSVLKATFYSARTEIGRRTRGQVHTPAINFIQLAPKLGEGHVGKCTRQQYMALNMAFSGAAEQLLVG